MEGCCDHMYFILIQMPTYLENGGVSTPARFAKK